ncbi:Mechanosensitive ion channel [Spongiibacter sp. IMCC21906]|uniref:mechanosensitive ion channel family protein n=1 Tax=Spongiibacter sp. IMCC21906 TaxID=1620392 RepID=UPI00062DE871|nr:mechanosensitive ion channel domain-containing protein [Spongiibacter sp. IMCC21906]AKH68288.1 Mechanosensitive ion channel [Spongiibacter sp. IMCC21906]
MLTGYVVITTETFLQSLSFYLSYPLVTLGSRPVTLYTLLAGAVIFGVAMLLSRAIRRSLRGVASRRPTLSSSSLYTVERLAHYTILIIGLVIALSTVGIDFSKLALIASALSVGIGFGLQAIFSNFVSGLIILIERSLKVGDYVQLESGVLGVVTEITVRATIITTLENAEVIVPNSEFVNGKVTNWTHTNNFCRLRIPFGVAYGTDKQEMREVVLAAAAKQTQTLTGTPGREPVVVMKGFGDSSLDFELLVWVKPEYAAQQSGTRSVYLWAIDDALADAGISIPFPQRDLHLISGFNSVETPQS